MYGMLTYASEGLCYAMVPTLHGYTLPTLGWVLLSLGVTVVAFSILGGRTFYKRVVN
jgi:ABC-2 type transport system permease protein